jgi:ribosomal-protein-alanine N-acetyltransferase
MKIFAETERLLLREIMPEDETGMFELDADPEVHKYLGNRPVQTMEQTREVIRLIRQQYNDYGMARWAVIEKGSNAFLGWAGLKFMSQLNHHQNYYDIGYRLLRKHWGQGYATEAATATRDYAFGNMNLDMIYGTTHIDNLASFHILKKIGLRFIETFPYEAGLTCNWLEMKRSDWEARSI